MSEYGSAESDQRILPAAALVASREIGFAAPVAKIKFEKEALIVSWEGWGESVFVTGSVELILSGEIQI